MRHFDSSVGGLMRSTYRVLAYLIALGVVLQATTVAFAWFAVINDLEGGAVFTADSELNIGHELHGLVGMNLMPLLALLLLISSFFAKIPGGIKWAGFVLLAVVAQVVLAIVAFSTPAIGALHGINAVLILALAMIAGYRVTGISTTPGVRHARTESGAGV